MSNPIVYVVDDDDACRKALGMLLPALGFTAKTFPSASDFLAQLSPESEGCVVADMRMPQISGVELISRMQEVAPMMPVILVSGVLSGTFAEEASVFGAAAVLSKPFDVDRLKESIDRALSQHRRQRTTSP